MCIDYKNETALRALTQTLLLEYYQLKVDFAPGSLIPTLPLRLNYILWLEDIMDMFKTGNDRILGIDIGCGSSCIYSLLAAKKNNWHMVALESNSTNFQYATNNVENNGLTSLITLHSQTDKTQIFKEYFESIEDSGATALKYDFCLCNPPFYDSRSDFNNKTRKSGKRPPPHNCPTGNKEELSCLGGEVKFVQQIIEESLLFKEKIRYDSGECFPLHCIGVVTCLFHISRVFTTMLGLKSSLSSISDTFKSLGIENTCSTEFHQGNTTRWGIAWSFNTNVHLNHMP